jgi:translation initiation factor IF-2
MSELNTPRLMAAAKEFNIGANTLIDFLVSKNLSGSDDLKPTSKLTDEMYRVLQGEYQGDKTAKEKADRVELVKTVSGDPKKKKDEQDLSFKKKEEKAKEVVKEEPKEDTKPIEVKPEVVEQAVVEVVAPIVVEEKQVVETETTTSKKGVTKVDAPELEGPKILDKIDLSTIDSSTRPKKGVKKKEESTSSAKKREEPKLTPKSAPNVEIPKEAVHTQEVAKDTPPIIENIFSERLTGPKILGKIQLPVDNDTRPKRDDAHKRKRIPIPKKPSAPGAGGGGAPTENRGPRPIIGDGGANRGGQGGGSARGPQQGGGARGPQQGGGGGNRFQRPGQGGAAAPRKEDKIIDAKEIQEKLKQSLQVPVDVEKALRQNIEKKKENYLTKRKATDRRKGINYR